MFIFDPINIGIGFVAGAFTPAIGRKIKSWFVKEGTVVKADVSNVASQATTAVKQAVVNKL